MTKVSQGFVVQGSFDGPIGLLVELIERNKIEINSVSLERITAEYLASVSEMKQLDPGQLAEFVQLAARLTYIKSLSLLPNPEQAGEELVALETDLAEYRRYRHAADMLAERSRQIRTWGRGAKVDLSASPLVSDISLEALSSAFQAALKRAQPLGQTSVLKRHFDIKVVMKALRSRLERNTVGLQSIIDQCHDRLEIVVTFLAILELLKEGSLLVRQENQFSDILLSSAEATA